MSTGDVNGTKEAGPVAERSGGLACAPGRPRPIRDEATCASRSLMADLGPGSTLAKDDREGGLIGPNSSGSATSCMPLPFSPSLLPFGSSPNIAIELRIKLGSRGSSESSVGVPHSPEIRRSGSSKTPETRFRLGLAGVLRLASVGVVFGGESGI